MTHWQTVLFAWSALQIPVGICVGKILKSSFADGQASSGETAGSVITNPRRLPGLHCHSNGCQKNQAAHAITATAMNSQNMGKSL